MNANWSIKKERNRKKYTRLLWRKIEPWPISQLNDPYQPPTTKSWKCASVRGWNPLFLAPCVSLSCVSYSLLFCSPTSNLQLEEFMHIQAKCGLACIHQSSSACVCVVQPERAMNKYPFEMMKSYILRPFITKPAFHERLSIMEV